MHMKNQVALLSGCSYGILPLLHELVTFLYFLTIFRIAYPGCSQSNHWLSGHLPCCLFTAAGELSHLLGGYTRVNTYYLCMHPLNSIGHFGYKLACINCFPAFEARQQNGKHLPERPLTLGTYMSA